MIQDEWHGILNHMLAHDEQMTPIYNDTYKDTESSVLYVHTRLDLFVIIFEWFYYIHYIYIYTHGITRVITDSHRSKCTSTYIITLDNISRYKRYIGHTYSVRRGWHGCVWKWDIMWV